MDTDFSSLARELGGGEEEHEVPPAYADLIDTQRKGEPSPPDDDFEDLRKSG